MDGVDCGSGRVSNGIADTLQVVGIGGCTPMYLEGDLNNELHSGKPDTSASEEAPLGDELRMTQQACRIATIRFPRTLKR